MADASRTFTAALPVDRAASAALDAYARLMARAGRTAHARHERALLRGEGQSKAQRKADLVREFGLTSRQANAVLADVEGRRAGLVELQKLQLVELSERLAKKKGQLRRLLDQWARHRTGRAGRLNVEQVRSNRRRVFEGRTKIEQLQARCKRLKARIDTGHTGLTFGTKQLLRQRQGAGDTAEERSLNHPLQGKALRQWRAQWDLSRNGQFLVLGSKDETGGCQGCVAAAHADGSFTLRLRLPDPLGGGHLVLAGVRFAYGADRLHAALAQQDVRAASRKALHAKAREAQLLAPVSQKAIEGGAALTWRFMRQADGRWRVAFTTEVAAAKTTTSRLCGAVGVDINAGFISVSDVDRHGNIRRVRNLGLPEVGRSAGQREAARGEAVKQVIALCRARHAPLVLEKLDFTRKKRDLRMRSPESRRKLSALQYSALYELFCARARDAGVEVIDVDPFYTSTQGSVRHAARRGWSVHQAAAGVIARRGLEFAERAPVRGTQRVLLAGTAVEWEVPAETSRSDASQRWPLLHRKLQQTIASYYRERRVAVQRDQAPRPDRGASVVAGGIPALNRTSRASGVA